MIDCVYDDAKPFSEGLAKVVMNKKGGYINKEGILILKSYKYFYYTFNDKTDYYSKSNLLNINCGTWQREPNLADRLVKAFQHLAELNRKELEANKPKEAF